jgi:uncharacterized membrane protein
VTLPEELHFAITLLALLGCGLIAGVFFAFSTFVMKALARLPPNEGIAAMQSINVVVLSPVFLTAFVGTAAVCVLAVIVALPRWSHPGAVYSLVGGALYLVGTFAVTRAFNIPRNDALAALTPTDSDAPDRWNKYVSGWTAWNHVRTVAALAAATAFGFALRS